MLFVSLAKWYFVAERDYVVAGIESRDHDPSCAGASGHGLKVENGRV